MLIVDGVLMQLPIDSDETDFNPVVLPIGWNLERRR